MERAKKTEESLLSLYNFALFDRRQSFVLLLLLGLRLSVRDKPECPAEAGTGV
jgi:hypothetical protein